MMTRKLLYLFRLIFSLLLIVITYLATARIEHQVLEYTSDKLNHLVAFYTLALCADLSFPSSRYHVSKGLPLLGYGVLIEVIQHHLPYRFFSLLDIAADAVGLLMYGVSIPLLNRLPSLQWRVKTKTW